MKKSTWQTGFQCLIILLGISIGIYFSQQANQLHSEEHQGLMSHSSMNHGYLDISNDSIIPTLENLTMTKDPMTGWNIHFDTKNFQFTPENASSKHITGQGHAHLMINGKKVARIYAHWFHIPQLADEIKEIEITLNANSHAIMSVHQQPIAIKLTNL